MAGYNCRRRRGDVMDRQQQATERARRRLRGFIIHLMIYFAVMLVLVPLNFILSERPWFLLPMVGWGAPLALHAAWAMGFFDFSRN
jgi:hypothetical protein